MLSRIFWIALAGIALIGGMILQDGGRIFSWGDDAKISQSVGHQIETRVDAAIDGSFDKMEVTGSDGREIDVPTHTKRALAQAVGELVKAETDLALVRVDDGTSEERRAAEARRDRARAEVDRLKDEIEGLEKAAQSQDDALREQIRQEVREDVRATVRDSVRP